MNQLTLSASSASASTRAHWPAVLRISPRVNGIHKSNAYSNSSVQPCCALQARARDEGFCKVTQAGLRSNLFFTVSWPDIKKNAVARFSLVAVPVEWLSQTRTHVRGVDVRGHLVAYPKSSPTLSILACSARMPKPDGTELPVARQASGLRAHATGATTSRIAADQGGFAPLQKARNRKKLTKRLMACEHQMTSTPHATLSIPITIPLISEIRPRHHTPVSVGTGVPSVL